MRDVKWSQLMRIGIWTGHGPSSTVPVLLLMSQLTNPMLAQSEQRSITSAQSSADQSKGADSKVPAKPQKELPPAEPSTQEPKPAQPNTQTSKSDETKTKKENGEEGAEKGKESTGRKAVSSLILTVKLALLGDPRLFPYEIEVEPDRTRSR